MTEAEARAFNRGVPAVLAVARQCADTLALRQTRPLAEGFAIEALDELAMAGRALLIPTRPDGSLGPDGAAPTPPPRGPVPAAADVAVLA